MTTGAMLAAVLAALHFAGASARLNTKETACLARAIYHEARGEPVRGQALVAGVILNRVAKLPSHSICQAIAMPGQFPWARKQVPIKSSSAFIHAATMAVSVQVGRVPSATHAMFFYNASLSRPPCTRGARLFRVGHHIFAAPHT